jgi:hypothetical protein
MRDFLHNTFTPETFQKPYSCEERPAMTCSNLEIRVLIRSVYQSSVSFTIPYVTFPQHRCPFSHQQACRTVSLLYVNLPVDESLDQTLRVINRIFPWPGGRDARVLLLQVFPQDVLAVPSPGTALMRTAQEVRQVSSDMSFQLLLPTTTLLARRDWAMPCLRWVSR